MILSIVLSASIAVSPGAFMNPYDGDTLRLKLRLADIDTPEIKGDCDAERSAAINAREFTRRFIHSRDVTINFVGTGYYGRPLVRVCDSRTCLSTELKRKGLAVDYIKGRKGNPWC